MTATKSSFSQISVTQPLRPLLFTCLALIFTTVKADGIVDEPAASGRGMHLKYATRQLERLGELPAPCFARLVGNAQSADVVTALALQQSNDCGGQAAGTTASVRVIPLKPAGMNLVRVEQNFGGSYTLVRYSIVSIVIQPTPSDSGVNETLILVRRALLPPEDLDQAVAVRKASKLAAALSSGK
jgi:hypothetical protein